MNRIRDCIEQGRTALGIELGSTRIKAVLIDDTHMPIASGSYEWENRYENGIWTYSMENVWEGLRTAYAELKRDVFEQYNTELRTIGVMGFSAMMHGYLPFDAAGNQLVPFRTWRNTMTSQAAEQLTQLLSFNIPQRWSIAHLVQAILNGEEHISHLSFFTTLAGYVHWKLTGEKVLGIGEASGMFPVDSNTGDYDAGMLQKINSLLTENNIKWKLENVLPHVLLAGEAAGTLTEDGARLLDPTGMLQSGIPLCPPEGDAGTGMVATNSVAARTGNVSAGTSVFAMVVLEHALSKVYPEIDMVATPSGKPVAMVHCNNCTNEINAWAGLFSELCQALGISDDKNKLFTALFQAARKGEPDCGGLLTYNYLSGEPITGFEEGRPLFARRPDSRFTLNNFMRAQLYSACATLKLGMDILLEQEKVSLDRLFGHGGFFKTPEVGQRVMAAALKTPVAVMQTAGEGGAWGCALLAAFLMERTENQNLEDFLACSVFADNAGCVFQPDASEMQGFDRFMKDYRAGLSIQRAAIQALAERKM